MHLICNVIIGRFVCGNRSRVVKNKKKLYTHSPENKTSVLQQYLQTVLPNLTLILHSVNNNQSIHPIFLTINLNT